LAYNVTYNVDGLDTGVSFSTHSVLSTTRHHRIHMTYDTRETQLSNMLETIMGITPKSETRRLLKEAKEISNDVLGDCTELTIIAVFQRLCAETDMAGPDFPGTDHLGGH
jgi:hypothetical protein